MLARQLAGLTGLPLVERDGLGEEGSPGYLSAIAEMAARPRWILDGAPYYAHELVYAAADTVVFLDYPKALVLWRVLRRTASIEMLRRPVGAHRPQGLAALRDREHPIRWAWTSHRDRHREGLALMARPGLAQTQSLRFTRPSMARRWLRQIVSALPVWPPLGGLRSLQPPSWPLVHRGEHIDAAQVDEARGDAPPGELAGYALYRRQQPVL